MSSNRDNFPSIRTEGAILPMDLLRRILDADRDIPGIRPEDYHLAPSERLNEVATRAWNRLQGAWHGFKEAMAKLPESDSGTRLTRERWLLILFQELGYGRLTTRKAYESGGRTYPISHAWQNTPIHLVSFRQELDRRTPGRAGASRVSPHSLVQEWLNASADHLWGLVSNGLSLRLLRDNVSLTRQAYVEFDLQAMMDAEAYSDFLLLFLLCHQSRVEVPEGKTPEHCWLEKWYNTAIEQGVRALDQLRDGVQRAIEALGGGFLACPANVALREKLRRGDLATQDYYRQVLRQVYRLLFLFVAEDRELLADPAAPAEARALYQNHYATTRIRALAGKTRGTRHPDLWRALRLVLETLYSGSPELALPALGGFLFAPAATPDLNGQDIANADLLRAVRALTSTVDGNIRRQINYRNLGPEELGSVYESLLEMHPVIHMDASKPEDRFALRTGAGSERKTTGSYYTHSSLVNCLLDSALDPVLDEAVRQEDPERALLRLKVCDPACGSGHFLIAAAHRLAKRLAAVRTGEEEPAPEHYQHALRDVIARCIYGVDINPMSVELCKVSLWLEAMEPGKPLAFLDHHIKCGNSLLGATPALLERGIPDAAFNPIEGDDKVVCAKWRRENRREREGRKENPKGRVMKQASLLSDAKEPYVRLGDLAASVDAIDAIPDDTLQGVREKERRYQELAASASYLQGRLWADAFCAAFVWIKTTAFDYPVTEFEFRKIRNNPHATAPWMREEIVRLSEQYKFFHWHLEFPEVFKPKPAKDIVADDVTGWSGGFDCVLGNPPWERVKIQEKEWFAERDPEIATAPNAAARKKRIAVLKTGNPQLHHAFLNDVRKAEGESQLLRTSGRYPLCGRGDINLYAVFAEAMRTSINDNGRMGCVLPSGIATDDTTKFFFQDVIETKSLVSLFDFENRKKTLFPTVDSRMKFCLFTSGSGALPAAKAADFAFFAHAVEDLHDPEKRFTLSSEEITRLNPNTRTCPIFRTRHDAELTKAIYRRVPVLIRQARDGQPEENPWGISFNRMFDMSNDSHLFRTREQLEDEGWRLEGNVFRKEGEEYLPLYEAKMVGFFDHRAAGIVLSETATVRQGQPDPFSTREHEDPMRLPIPRSWVGEGDIKSSVGNKWSQEWFLGIRDVTSATNERTVISSFLPYSGVGNNLPVLLLKGEAISKSHMLCTCLNSFILDFAARFKVGGLHLNFFIVEQFPVATFQILDQNLWAQKLLLPRMLELIFTAWDLKPLAKDWAYSGPPFRWDDERRLLMRCELDAAFFQLYLPANSEGGWQQAEGETNEELARLKDAFPTPRDAVAYIMETFPIVKRKDVQAHGGYRTKDTILEIHDAMAEAMRTGRPYQTRLDPPPGPPVDANGDFIPMERWAHDAWPPHIHPPREEARPKRTRPLSREELPHLQYLESERASWAYLLIPHFVRLKPGLSIDDYLDMALFATTPELGRDLLPASDQRLLRQAREAAGIEDLPREPPINRAIVQKLLQRNGLHIDSRTRTCRLAQDFNPRGVPEVEAIAHYAYLILDKVKAIMNNAIERDKNKPLLDELDRLRNAS